VRSSAAQVNKQTQTKKETNKQKVNGSKVETEVMSAALHLAQFTVLCGGAV
jgi:hypothetical protein